MTPEELRIAREESANVAYQTFIKYISENKNGLFCFYEGKDAAYYYVRIKQFNNGITIFPISCKGKSMVLKVHELISNHKEYAKYKKGFFVDKDFDESILNYYIDIFETDCYSIENYYVSEECLTEILKNEFGITEIEESFKNAMEYFSSKKEEVLDAQELFNAWYCCLKEKKRSESLPTTGVKLSEKFPKGYIKVKEGKFESQYDLERIWSDYVDAIKVEEQVIQNKIDELRKADRVSVFRGKYLLEFFHKLLQALVEDSNTKQNIIKTKIKYHIELNQVMTTFSPYAKTPDTLISYLKTVI